MYSPASGRNPIFAKILSELEKLPLPPFYRLPDLQEYMELNFFELPVSMVDQWATCDDLRVIAGYFPIPPSVLIQLKGDNQATARAFFDELWPVFQGNQGVSKEDAWKSVESSSAFRGEHPAEIRTQVQFILDGLLPPDRPSSCPYFLDCIHGCVAKCAATGRKPGA